MFSTVYPPSPENSWIKGFPNVKRRLILVVWGEVGQSGESQYGRVWHMFLGEYQHSVDGKGRIAIPARFRPKIERGAVMTRGVDTCLYVYPMDIWEQKARALDAAVLDPRQRRLVERRFFGMAYELELDAQGRIVIPTRFRQYAELNGDATVVGARDRFEIWSTTHWEAYTTQMATEDLGELVLPF